MAAYAQHDFSIFSRRTTAFALIVCLHAVLIYALATGLAHRLIEVIPPRMQTGWFSEAQKPDQQPLPPPAPKFASRPVDVPKSEFTFDVPPDAKAIQDVAPRTEEQPLLPPSTPAKVVSRVLGGPGKAFPNTDDYYPPVAIRLGETGIATVRTCVDDKGRLTAAPTLAQSSGSASIDEGALKLAKAGSGHYRATTEDGRPVSSCYEFRIRFDLRDLRR